MIAEESRLKILCILNKGKHCVCEIMEQIPLSQSLISHHLSDLKKEDVVKDIKKGRKAYYSLTLKGKKIMTFLSDITE